MIRKLLQQLGRVAAAVLVFPMGASCWLVRQAGGCSATLFRSWGQFFAVIPGMFGAYLRRAFYRMTLEECSTDCHLGFGALISHQNARIEAGVYVGSYALLGQVILRQGCMIGSRASIVSGKNQHAFDGMGKWLPANLDDFVRIEIGRYAWVGEASVIMANIGKGTAVSAGAVVSNDLPDYVVVAGNPARFVRRLDVDSDDSSEVDSPDGSRDDSGDDSGSAPASKAAV